MKENYCTFIVIYKNGSHFIKTYEKGYTFNQLQAFNKKYYTDRHGCISENVDHIAGYAKKYNTIEELKKDYLFL